LYEPPKDTHHPLVVFVIPWIASLKITNFPLDKITFGELFELPPRKRYCRQTRGQENRTEQNRQNRIGGH